MNTQLVKEISLNLGRKNNIIPIPSLTQKIVKTFKPNIHQRLFGNLVVDNSQTRKELNYKPEYSFEQGIKEMVEWYKANSEW